MVCAIQTTNTCIFIEKIRFIGFTFVFLVEWYDLDRYIDDDQLVVNFKKQDPDLKWPDIMESWESLTTGSTQLLKGTSIYLVGDSTEINQQVAQELATGLGYEFICDSDCQYSYCPTTYEPYFQFHVHRVVTCGFSFPTRGRSFHAAYPAAASYIQKDSNF